MGDAAAKHSCGVWFCAYLSEAPSAQCVYPRIIGRENQNQPILYNILEGVPKIPSIFLIGVQYILGLLAEGAEKFYRDEGC